MLPGRHSCCVAIAATVALLALSCVIDEELRINGDGSGTYRVKITVPKNLSGSLGDLRQKAATDGYRFISVTDAEDGHSVVYEKEFASVAALNDTHDHYELTISNAGFLRREYHLTCTVGSNAFTAFKRRLTIRMPGSITSASTGERNGDRVSWDCSNGGTIDIVASGFYLPLDGNQKELFIALLVIASGLLLFRAATRAHRRTRSVVCSTCHKELPAAARFCADCGAVTST